MLQDAGATVTVNTVCPRVHSGVDGFERWKAQNFRVVSTDPDGTLTVIIRDQGADTRNLKALGNGSGSMGDSSDDLNVAPCMHID